MPNNFRHIGLIHLIMPNAKIIDARRNPLDCCFSMFKQLFAQGQEFSYGLAEAGSYYKSYVKLMDHWDRVLPGKILRVNNEDVIEDLEGQVKRMLDFLELPFERECISFHETDRSVRTASSEQVRQPINKKGMGRWKPYAKVKKIIGVQLQSNEYFDRLNLSDLLLLFANLYSTSIEPKALLAKVNLEDKLFALPDDLSGGQKQRFSIACALVNNPKILFLDEPTTGLDPQAKRNLWNLAKELNEEGMTILLTTHNMEEAEYLCDRIAIMDKGLIIAQDTPQQLILDFAPEPTASPKHGNIEDVFLALTGHGLRD